MILDFIEKYFGKEEAEKLSNLCEYDLDDISSNPLVKAGGIAKVLQFYIKHNPEIKHKLLQTNNSDDSEENQKLDVLDVPNNNNPEVENLDESDGTKSDNKSSSKDQADESKEDSEINNNNWSNDNQQQDKNPSDQKPDKNTTNKRDRDQTNDANLDDSSNKRQKTENGENAIEGSNSRKIKPFSRIAKNYANDLANEFQDNTFEAKVRYGRGGDNYGIASNEKLRDKQGKNFRKEKTKMKKKNFHGAGMKISYQVNSIKF